jgi:hypothetical protein
MSVPGQEDEYSPRGACERAAPANAAHASIRGGEAGNFFNLGGGRKHWGQLAKTLSGLLSFGSSPILN